jgi:type III pantothenate kinase
MLLALDIGNTSITAGLFKANKLLNRFDTPVQQYNYINFLRKITSKNPIDSVIVCSVVPVVSQKIKKNLRKIMPDAVPLILGHNCSAPVKNHYRYPKQVGQDRLVNAYAAIKLFGGPAIVVDFGTALTFDVISANKEYLGGMIVPGLKTSLDSLAEKTALLPRIKPDKPKEFIGRDTKNSMLSGIIYGFAGLTDGLSGQIKKKIGKEAKIIGTGGHIKLIAPYCKIFDAIDTDLTLKGLNLIYQILP